MIVVRLIYGTLRSIVFLTVVVCVLIVAAMIGRD